MNKPVMLKVTEAADYLGVSKGFLDKLRITGGGPEFYKIGAQVRYTPADLDAWLSERKRASTSEYAA